MDDAHTDLFVRQLFERGLDGFRRALHVCLDDEVQLLHLALLQLGEQALELDLLLALLDELARHAFVGDDAEFVAR